MEILGTENRVCTCCMTVHDVKRVRVPEANIYRGFKVEYDAEYFYCDVAHEYFADEDMMAANRTAMKDAYRVIRRAV